MRLPIALLGTLPACPILLLLQREVKRQIPLHGQNRRHCPLGRGNVVYPLRIAQSQARRQKREQQIDPCPQALHHP